MRAKITSRNRIRLPKSSTQAVGATGYVDVDVRAGQIILTPVHGVGRGEAVWAKLAERGVSAVDVADAVAWARQAPE